MQKYIAFIQRFLDFFRRHGDDDRSLMEKLRDKYRLVIMNDDTFEEVTSVKLTPLSVYVAFSSLVVGTAIVVVLLVVYTPLKRYIPGYGDFRRDAEVAELTSKLSALEEEVQANRRFNENFRKILVGDMRDFSKEASQKQGQADTARVDTLAGDVDRIPEDQALRSAVEKGTFTREETRPGGLPAQNANEPPLEQLFFMPPVAGDVTSGFDPTKGHYGIDIAAPKNTAVKAAADGMVISAGYTVETGYSLAVQHPNNVVTLYKHNSVLLKKQGSPVKAGEALAIIGNSGENTTGPHLHFELWYKGRAVDPGDYMTFN